MIIIFSESPIFVDTLNEARSGVDVLQFNPLFEEPGLFSRVSIWQTDHLQVIESIITHLPFQ